MIDGKYEYFAFVSYKEEDAEWAKWLQRKLEHYKLPTALRKENPNLPERISPIYEYKTEAGGGRLKEVIWKGLTSSKYLIVICSPRATKSEWLNKGIRYFVESGLEENIIPFIVEGKPKANNPDEECFPSELLKLTGDRELRGININEMGRDAAAVKVVSQMFDVKFDSLWQRYEREQRQQRRKKLGSVLGGITILAIASVAFAFIVSGKNAQLEKANIEISKERDRANVEREKAEKANVSLSLANDSIIAQQNKLKEAYENLSVSEVNLAKSINELKIKNIRLTESRKSLLEAQSLYMAKEANDMINHGQYVHARKLAADALPISLSYPNRPYVIEAEEAFRNSFNIGNMGNIYDCIDCLYGHTDCIEFVDISPEDNHVLSISQDNTLRIWNLTESEQTYFTKKNVPLKAYFLPSENKDNLLLVYNQYVVLWNMKINMNLKEYGPVQMSNPLLDKDRENLIFYDSFKKQIVVFNIKRWDISSQYNIHCDNINEIDIDKNMDYIVIGCGKTFSKLGEDNSDLEVNSLSVLDMKSGNVLTKKGFKESIEHVSISKNGEIIAYTHFYDNNIYIVNRRNLVVTDTLKGHTKTIQTLSFSPSKSYEILSGSYDHSVKVWNLYSNESIDIPCPSNLNSWPYCLSYSTDGERFVGGLWEKLFVWGHPQTDILVSFDNVDKFFFSKKGDYLCYVEKANMKVHILDTNSFREISRPNSITIFDWHHDDIAGVLFYRPDFDCLERKLGYISKTIISNEGTIAYIVHESNDYKFFISKVLINHDGYELLKTVDLDVSNSCLNDIKFSINEKYLVLSFGVLSSEGNAAIVVDAKSLNVVSRYEDFNSGILMSCFIPNSNNIASCSYDMSIKIWDFLSGQLKRPLFGHRDFVQHVSSCFNGRYLVSSGQDGLINIWETMSWKTIETMHFGAYEHPVVISPNGKFIAIQNGNELIIKEFKSINKLWADIKK